MAFFSNDHVVVDQNPKWAARLNEHLRHLNVGTRGGWIAGRMIVRKNDSRRVVVQRALDHFARVDRHMVNGTGLMLLVRNEPVALVQKQKAKLLRCLESNGSRQISEHIGPAREHGLACDFRAVCLPDGVQLLPEARLVAVYFIPAVRRKFAGVAVIDRYTVGAIVAPAP